MTGQGAAIQWQERDRTSDVPQAGGCIEVDLQYDLHAAVYEDRLRAEPMSMYSVNSGSGADNSQFSTETLKRCKPPSSSCSVPVTLGSLIFNGVTRIWRVII